jgi:capsular polysaccharide biosynthesis protein
MNIDDRLRAASKALKESSVAQVDAASRLREIVRRTGQPVAHGRTDVLLDEAQESPRSLAPSLPPSGKASAAPAGASAAAPPTSRWTDGETRSTFHGQPLSGNGVGGLFRSIWRNRWLVATAVLLGALLGSGWAARQPTLYQGVTQVVLPAGSGPTALPGEASYPPGEPEGHLRRQAQVISSSPVLARAVEWSGSRISVETLRQRLEVDAAAEADVLAIRVLDSTATGAAQLANAVAAAYDQVLAQQWRESFRARVRQLQDLQSALQARLAQAEGELARNPNDSRLRAQCKALTDQDREILRQLRALERSRPVLAWERAAVPKQPTMSPSPGRAMAIGMLLGLLAAAVLVWWLTRRQGPTSRSSAPEQGPELPRPN